MSMRNWCICLFGASLVWFILGLPDNLLEKGQSCFWELCPLSCTTLKRMFVYPSFGGLSKNNYINSLKHLKTVGSLGTESHNNHWSIFIKILWGHHWQHCTQVKHTSETQWISLPNWRVVDNICCFKPLKKCQERLHYPWKNLDLFLKAEKLTFMHFVHCDVDINGMKKNRVEQHAATDNHKFNATKSWCWYFITVIIFPQLNCVKCIMLWDVLCHTVDCRVKVDKEIYSDSLIMKSVTCGKALCENILAPYLRSGTAPMELSSSPNVLNTTWWSLTPMFYQ